MAGDNRTLDILRENFEALGAFFAKRKRFFAPLLAIITAAIGVPAAMLFLAPTILSWFASPLDLSKDLYAVNRPVAFTFLDASGREVGHRGSLIGERLKLEEMPAYLPAAFIAMEDRNFYSHQGFDMRGLLRALYANWRAGKTVQGGSTITQQTVKIVFLTQERTLNRKLEELLDATRLEKTLTKKQILELYLNRIYLGAAAYGVDGAARVYFNKSARDLTLSEAAMLATLTRAPSANSPRRDLLRAQARSATVLNAMVETGAITPAQAREARAHPAVIGEHTATDARNYYFDTAADEALRDTTVGGVAPSVDLIVHTNLDPKIQDAARATALNTIATGGRRVHASEAAVVTMKPDGAVVALVGGTDYDESTFNRATQAHRQPGSSFKPFVYLAALESGLQPWDVRADEPVDIDGWTPANYGGKSYGTMTLADALAHSVNTITANLGQEVGISNVMQAAVRCGIVSRLQENASLALGTSEVTPLEMTRAYAVFASGGVAVYPYLVTEVTDHAGRVLFRRRMDQGRPRVIATHVNRDLVAMLNGVVTHGTGMNAAVPGHETAGKTGTTQDFHDAWFVGFTHDYVTAVWVGNDDATPMKAVTGAKLPSQNWKATMTVAEDGLPDVKLDKSDMQPPADNGAIWGDESGGSYAPSASEEGGGDSTYYMGSGESDGTRADRPPPEDNSDDHRNFWDWVFSRRAQQQPQPPSGYDGGDGDERGAPSHDAAPGYRPPPPDNGQD